MQQNVAANLSAFAKASRGNRNIFSFDVSRPKQVAQGTGKIGSSVHRAIGSSDHRENFDIPHGCLHTELSIRAKSEENEGPKHAPSYVQREGWGCSDDPMIR
jgi:hypothetical protein